MLCAVGSMLQPGGETATAANGAHREGGGVTSADMAPIGDEEIKLGRGGEESGGGGGSGGNRWPRQETLALLQIRSDMDAVFRDSSHKGPLWDEVSRKMAEMGYKRSAKKCREKFENVYKYHKRTKDGRATKSDGKNYRFFEQLQALESSSSAAASSSFLQPIEAGAVPIAMAMPPPRQPPPPPPPPPPTTQPVEVTVLSTTPPALTTPPPTIIKNAIANPMSFPSSTSGTPSSSSSTSSDEEVTGMRSKRKRKWKEFFEKLTRDVVEKQEELHRKFLEAIDKRENDRRVREEAWKAQEMARLKREYDILIQERSATAAKDAALLSFLQKLSDQHKIPLPPPPQLIHSSHVPPPKTPISTTPAVVQVSPMEVKPTPTPTPTLAVATVMPLAIQASPVQKQISNGAGDPSSSRWPKAEIDALIKLRTSMEPRYQENNGPKGALWEEISSGMRGLGYNRNSKRCKEKWENINKYYKRMKEGNKRRRDDAKTCPYYHQLEELYRDKKAKIADAPQPPIMARPEQQWPLQQPPQDPVSDHMDQDDDEDEDYDEDEDLDGGYEIVANNGSGHAASMGGAAAAMEAR